MRKRWYPAAVALLGVLLLLSPQVASQWNGTPVDQAQSEHLKLVQATMCEAVTDGKPLNAAVIFSTDRERVSCFTAFDPVPEETHIYHKWFHHDNSVAQIKLSLKPPRWSTYSSIHLRESDKGPWRVEIIDKEDRRLKTLRFSITD